MDVCALPRVLVYCLSIVRGDLQKTNLCDGSHMSGVGCRARKPSALKGTGNSPPPSLHRSDPGFRSALGRRKVGYFTVSVG